jgi:hypothetical protein
VATYSVSRAVHATLAVGVVDTCVLNAAYQTVLVVNRGTGVLYCTTDGSEPAVGGTETLVIPPGMATDLPVLAPLDPLQAVPATTTAKLISSTAAAYSVLANGLNLRPATTTTTTGGSSSGGAPAAHAPTHAVGGTDVVSPDAIGAVANTRVAATLGIATLDINSNVVQQPPLHYHALRIMDSGGTEYDRGKLDIYAGTGGIVDDPANDRVQLILPTPIIQRVTSTAVNSVTNSATLTEIPDLTVPLAAGDALDFDLRMQVSSTTAAGLKVAIVGPTGSTMNYSIWGPQSTQTSFDSTVLRFVTLNSPTAADQQFGGFGDSPAMTTIRASGTVSCPTGVSGSLQVKIRQATATSGITTSVVPTVSRSAITRFAFTTVPPSGPSSIVAVWSDLLVDAVGVNTHIAYPASNSIYRFAGPYVDADTAVVTSLQAVGIRHIRETLAYGSGTMRTRLPVLCAAADVDVCMAAGDIAAHATGAQAVTEVNTYYHACIAAVEGLNEPDGDASDWGTQTRTHQIDLANNARALGITVLGPSMAGQTYTGTGWPGDLSDYVDISSLHIYPGGQKPSTTIDTHLSRQAAMNGPGKPLWITETGYQNAMNSTQSNPKVPEDVSGVYGPLQILESFSRGIARSYFYELGDDQREDPLTQRERHFGLFAWDAQAQPTWRMKPIGTALKNFITLMADPGTVYGPAPLSVSVTGTGVKSLLVGKRDGSYLICLWRDVTIYTPSQSGTGSYSPVTPVTATVTFGASKTVHRYRPSTSASSESTATNTVHTASVAGELVVLQIT